MKTLKLNFRRTSIKSLLLIAPYFFFLVSILGCSQNIEDKKQAYKDIIGYWKEYIVKDGEKEETSLRKIILNSNGELEQSIVYELATQCRIWLNDDEISYLDGHLEFWDGEFTGDISEDKNTFHLIYKQMDNPFLLERIQDKKTIQLLDSLENCIGGEYKYSIPKYLDDYWESADLEQEGFNKKEIIDLIENIIDGEYDDIHSLLIVKNGKLVLEEYFNSNGQIFGNYVNDIYSDRVQMLASVTKSVNSALVGMAINQGYIQDVNVPVSEFFPEYPEMKINGKEKILLKHLLSMSAGLQWNELDISYNNSNNDVNKMERSANLIKYCLDKPLVMNPGEKFDYSTGLSVILCEIIERSVGIEADKYAKETLFKALGISQYKWSRRKNNILATGGGLALRARDMAKIGQLYLNEGKWNDQQVLTEDWINASIQPHVSTFGGRYGYQWWLRRFIVNDRNIHSYYADGRGGQFIFVFPEFELIIVSTAQNYMSGYHRRFYRMLEDKILPALTKINK